MNVVITGSNRGIGKVLVEQFAKTGYNIWACARKQDFQFEQYLNELSIQNGVRITPIYFDLSSEDEIKEGIKQIFSAKEPIDVLINNAGVAYGGLMTMTSIDKIRDVYEVNVFAQVQIMQLVARKMMRQRAAASSICVLSEGLKPIQDILHMVPAKQH